MPSRCCLMIALWLSLLSTASAQTESADDLLKKAKAALMQGEGDEATALLTKAIALDGKHTPALQLRAAIAEARGKNAEALADLNKIVALDPKAAEAIDRRGSVHFKLGKFAESLADFDRFIALQPQEFAGHWRRGITCYYAGKFAEGRKQFEGYEKVDTNDVENAVWHFLCVARADGVEKARAALLKIGKDARVPMMEVYALYGGKAKPEDVLAAAQAPDLPADKAGARLFYAHLYLGLYYEVLGDRKKALEHMAPAAEKYKIRHYMGDVAQVHLDLLRQAK